MNGKTSSLKDSSFHLTCLRLARFTVILALLIGGLGFNGRPALAQDPKPGAPETGPAEQPALPGVPEDWLAQAQDYIARSEYHLSWAEEPLFPGAPAAYQAPNRAQDLRFYFQPDRLQVIRRTESEPTWTWSLALAPAAQLRYARLGELQVTENRAVIERAGLRQEFTNTELGLEQIITLFDRPESAAGGMLALDLEVTSDLTPHYGMASGLEFRRAGQTELALGRLQAVDAVGKTLAAGLHLGQPDATGAVGVQLLVDAQGAQFPLSISFALASTAGAPRSASGLSTYMDWFDDGLYPGSMFGYSVSTAGDVNGDSHSDVIIGAPGYDDGFTDRGRAFLYLGYSGGLPATPNWSYGGEGLYHRFGYSVALAGDVNYDGYGDVIIGAPYWYNPVSGPIYLGKAYVFYGNNTSAGLNPTPSWTYAGDQEHQHFGMAVAPAGDVNRDGFSDIIVGSPDWNYDGTGTLYLDAGRAYVFHGSGSGPATTPSWMRQSYAENDQFGYAVATAGDVNADGYADVLVGMPGADSLGYTNNGHALLYYGGVGGLSDSLATITGFASHSRFGSALATAGDVNGDNYADVILGAPHVDASHGMEGLIRVYYGGPGPFDTTYDWQRYGDTQNGFFGNSVATAGDVNGDGYADIIAGMEGYDGVSPDFHDEQGRAFVWFGSSTGLPSGSIWDPNNADWKSELLSQDGANVGFSVGTAGDVNGDGYSDVLIGVPHYTYSDTYDGITMLYLGGPGNLSQAAGWTYQGETEDINAGYAVAPAGDVNGDGYADILIGVPYYDVTGKANVGVVYMFPGSPTGPLLINVWWATGDQADTYFGKTLDTAGDVNGDGYDDIIVGAPDYASPYTQEGKVFVWLGGPWGLGTPSDPAGADWTAESDWAYSFFGTSVASAGDVNGDGYGDIAVGMPFTYHGSNYEEGYVYVWHGGPGGLGSNGTLANADWYSAGGAQFLHLGEKVAMAGDVNKDGYSDLIASGMATDYSLVRAWYGSASGLRNDGLYDWQLAETTNQFGYSIHTAGDVNGDGYSEIIVGAPAFDSLRGIAFVYCGSASGLGAACWYDTGSHTGAYFGAAVGGGGDLNGDGYSEVVVGSPLFTNPPQDWEGQARVYYGGPSGLVTFSGGDWVVEGDFTYAALGFAVATVGDVNGDAYCDLLLGAQNHYNARGKVYLYYGSSRMGYPLLPRQFRSDGSTPIAHLGNASSPFRFGVNPKGPMGRGYFMVWVETKPLSQVMSGGGVYTDWTWRESLAPLVGSHPALQVGLPHHWRMVFRYDAVSNVYAPKWSRWFRIPVNGMNETDFRTPGIRIFAPLVRK